MTKKCRYNGCCTILNSFRSKNHSYCCLHQSRIWKEKDKKEDKKIVIKKKIVKERKDFKEWKKTKGVYRRYNEGWYSSVMRNKKFIWIGTFDNPYDAKKAYDKFIKKEKNEKLNNMPVNKKIR